MGQSVKNSRRGGSRWAGLLPPPGSGDWTLLPTSPTEVTYTRRNPPPVGSTGIVIRIRNITDTSWLEIGYSGLVATPIGGLSSGHTYQGQIRWATAVLSLSEWSDIKAATTP